MMHAFGNVNDVEKEPAMECGYSTNVRHVTQEIAVHFKKKEHT